MSAQTWHASTLDELKQCFRFLSHAIPEKGWRIEWKVWRDIRSLSQNAFQHVIYEEISQYLISRGRTTWTPPYVKDSMKNNFLGWVDQEFIDIRTGEVTIRQVLRSTKDLDSGEACHYIDQMLAWCADIGCDIKIPTSCDYRMYKEAQAA